MPQPSIATVVPVLNEQDNIPNLVQEIVNVARTTPIREMIFVNDGSTDQTVSVLQQIRTSIANDPSMPTLRIVSHTQRAGQSTAMMNGVRAATTDLVITLDGDGQNDPADIVRLFETYQANPALGMVAGQRRKRNDSLGKRLSSRIANTIRRAILNDGVRDTGCSLKLIRRDVYARLPYFDHMHRFLPALVLREGYAIATVDVNHRPRVAGVSKYNLWNRLWVGIVDLFGVAWLARRVKNPQEVREI
jgi:dolichol-phosphate mannosyltransferase